MISILAWRRRALMWVAAALTALPAAAGDIYVGPDGSVAAALRQAREWRRLQRAEARDGVRIHLADAVYAADEPLFLRPEDSGTAEAPTVIVGGTLSGGLPVTGWRREGQLWVAEAPRRGGRIVETRQLWVNGRKAQLARGGWARMKAFSTADRSITLPEEAMPREADTMRAELFVLQRWACAILRIRRVERRAGEVKLWFHEPESRLEFEHPWPQPVINGERGSSAAFVQGARCLLDEEGEFWQSYPDGRIYYMPRQEDEALCGANGGIACQAVVPVLTTLVEIAGTEERPVEHIRFEGTRFCHAAWMAPSWRGHVTLQGGFPLIDAYKLEEPGLFHKAALENQAWIARPEAAVHVECARGIEFRDCTFEHLAATGLDMERRVHGSTIAGCLFHDIGGTAVMAGPFGEGAFETHIPYSGGALCDSLTVSRCIVRDATNEDWGAVGIACGYVSNTTVDACTVDSVNYSGICMGWGWTARNSGMHHNSITNNIVSHYARHLYDAGGIYTLSRQPGSVISRNTISAPEKAPFATNDRAFAIYFDEATDGFTVTGNTMDPASIGWNQPGADMTVGP